MKDLSNLHKLQDSHIVTHLDWQKL